MTDAESETVTDRDDEDGWEFEKDRGRYADVRCPECGEAGTYSKELAVLSEELTCRNCGHTTDISGPSPTAVVLLVAAVYVYVGLHVALRKIRSVVLGA